MQTKSTKRVKKSSNAKAVEKSRIERDIAPAPPIQDRARRDAACRSLLFFLRDSFPATFNLNFCPDHEAIISRLEQAITTGGLFAVGAPRGMGKSSLCERASLWGILSGKRRFVVLVAANEALAEQSLGRLKQELEMNPLLLAQFPKMTFPLHKLESQSRRCVGQLYEQNRTAIVWQKKRVVFPTMPGPDNEGSGAVIHACGITGAVRGLSHVDASGATFRPDMLICDDPSDREASRSVIQTSERMSILTGDLLGLAGPGKTISCVVPCTIINRGDLADKLLDVDAFPEWHGETFKLLYSWPTRMDLWESCLSLRKEGMRPGGDPLAATTYYAANRSEMDEGARVAWEDRLEPGDLSALQHCFNLRAKVGEDAWMSEFQNEPVDHAKDLAVLDPAAIASRLNGFDKNVAPPECEKITAFLDIGQTLIWWLVAGWDESFGCHILSYGCHPEQRSRVFLTRNASPTLEQVYPGGVEAAVYGGITAVVSMLAGREWRRSDGATLQLSRALIDAGWLDKTVRLAIRQSPHKHLLTPSKGFGVGPGQCAINDYHKRPGEKLGDSWILGHADPGDRLRLLRFDSNAHKSRLSNMLTRPMGQKGGVDLYGSDPREHELIALHLSSEVPEPTTSKGRTVDVWSRRPDRDNHLLDAAVGVCIAASLEGLSPLASLGDKPVEKPPPKRYRASEAIAARQSESAYQAAPWARPGRS